MSLRFVCELDGSPHSVDRIGGKAANLGRLRAFGLPVPAAWAVTTEAYRLHAQRIGVPMLASQVAIADLPAIRMAIVDATMPDDVSDEIGKALESFGAGDDVLAVRSSATTEDSPQFSFAGLHDTSLSVRNERSDVELAIRQCWSSLWSERSVGYRRRGGETLDAACMGVVIQQLVRSDVSFVLFTVDPVHDCAPQIVISASFGLGESIVAGLVRPDQIVIGFDGAIVSYDIGSKETMVIPRVQGTSGVREVPVPHLLSCQKSMTHDQAIEIGEMARKLETRFGVPLDIEGGIAKGQTYLFQVRPITTCARRI